MDRLAQRVTTARRALATLREVSGESDPSTLVRDAAIQRFEYSFEALWKLLQLYLRAQEGVDAGSPKGVVRACFQAGVLDEEQSRLALNMVDDRNLTVHTYNEALAKQIYSRLAGYGDLMNSLVERLEQRAGAQ